MNRYPFPHLFFLLIFVLLANSCVPTQTSRSEVAPTPDSHANTFIAAFGALPQSIAPYEPRTWHKMQILPLLYNGLTALDKAQLPLPALASGWEISSDGLVYTMTLRRGVQFHHGKELEAADVRYSLQQAALRSQQVSQGDGAPFTFIADMQILDRYTIRFVLKEPYAPFLTKLTVTYCPIIPQGVSATSRLVPPGTGPFRLLRFQPGQAVVFKKFPAYWEKGLPRLDAILLRGIKSAAARLRLLQSGEIDFAVLEPGSLERTSVRVDAEWEIVDSAPMGIFSAILNTQRQPFVDVNVRRAFALAVDKSVLIGQVLGHSGVSTTQPFSPDASPWYVEIAGSSPDVVQAQALLRKAGYAEGVKVSLPVVAGATLFTKTALALREQLRGIGIDLYVEPIPVERLHDRMAQGQWDILLRGEPSQPDPDDVYFGAFHSLNIGASNMSGYHAPILDDLLIAGRRTLELDKRRQIYASVVKQIQEDVPELYLFMVRWSVVWRHRVLGYDPELLRCCLTQALTEIADQGFKTIWLKE